MRPPLILTLLLLGLLGSAPAYADSPTGGPCRASSPERAIPPALRIQAWSRFLEENPQTPYREEILRQISEAVKELSGASEAECREISIAYAYLKDATLNPFSTKKGGKSGGPKGPKGENLRPVWRGGDIGDGTLNPFLREGASAAPSKRNLSANPSGASMSAPLPYADGTLNPFRL